MPGSYQYVANTVVGGGGGGGTVPSASSLGAQDAASRTGLYLVEDFTQPYVAPPGSPQISTFIQSGATGAGCGANGVTYPTAELAQHPGLGFISSTGTATGYAQIAAANQQIPVIGGSGVTITWEVVFRTPQVVSNGTDTYRFNVGCQGAQQTAFHGAGAGIGYTDSVNSGNWQMFTVYPANEVVQYTNTAVPFVPATWNILRIVFNGAAQFAISLNGSALGTVTDANLTASFTWLCSAGALFLQRTAFTSGAVQGLIDRASVYMTPLTR